MPSLNPPASLCSSKAPISHLPTSRAQSKAEPCTSHPMTRLIAEIENQNLTQADAAQRMGITQPRVSDLMRGKLHLFSIDTLVALLAGLGLRVDFKVRKVA